MLSRSFRSLKPHNHTLKPNSIPKPPNPSKSPNFTPVSSSSKSPASTSSRARSKSERLWSVYLILSTNSPIKTYVGVTNNFSRRLKQHNGELKGGAKASRAGRPWVCACIVRGFHDKSEACAFESKWKNVSKKLPRKRKTEDDPGKELGEAGSLLLLQHSYDCGAFVCFYMENMRELLPDPQRIIKIHEEWIRIWLANFIARSVYNDLKKTLIEQYYKFKSVRENEEKFSKKYKNISTVYA